MGFDPSTIRKPRFTTENLPEGAGREERILALAATLHERGLTASMADARRLAEGMVDTERKVMKQTTSEETHEEDLTAFRRRLQSESKLFKDVIGERGMLVLPEEFASFVNRAASAHRRPTPAATPSVTRQAPAPVTYGRGDERHVIAEVPRARGVSQRFYDEAPDPRALRTTQVEQTASGMAIREETRTPTATVVKEQVIIEEPAPARPFSSPAPVAPAAPVEPAPKKEEPPEAKVDLFNIFKAGK